MIIRLMRRSCLSVILMLSLATLASCVSTQPYQTKKSVTSIAFSPDRTLLAFANANEIRVLEVDSKRHVKTLRALPPDLEEADPQLFRHGVGDNMVFLDNNRIASTGMGKKNPDSHNSLRRNQPKYNRALAKPQNMPSELSICSEKQEVLRCFVRDFLSLVDLRQPEARFGS